MGTQFSLHKISCDPEGFSTWDNVKLARESKKFKQILANTLGPTAFYIKEDELREKFLKWAASWDCKENESKN